MSRINDSMRFRGNRVFTTGEAAEICAVSQQTIIRAFDSGRLSGFRVPGSRSRRIPRAALVAFMRTNEIPLTMLEGPQQRVLIIESDPAAGQKLLTAFASDERFVTNTARTSYGAGILTERWRPHLVILHRSVPDLDVEVVCQILKANPEVMEPRIIVMSGELEGQDIDRLREAGMDHFMRTPFRSDDLIESAEHLLDLD